MAHSQGARALPSRSAGRALAHARPRNAGARRALGSRVARPRSYRTHVITRSRRTQGAAHSTSSHHAGQLRVGRDPAAGQLRAIREHARSDAECAKGFVKVEPNTTRLVKVCRSFAVREKFSQKFRQ